MEIHKKPKPPFPGTVLDGEETVTLNELHRALELYGHSKHVARQNAEAYVRIILEHREPEWEGGDVVKDASGIFWRRSRSDAAWYRFGFSDPRAHDRPMRPLELIGKELG